jgi:hypothetical protein
MRHPKDLLSCCPHSNCLNACLHFMFTHFLQTCLHMCTRVYAHFCTCLHKGIIMFTHSDKHIYTWLHSCLLIFTHKLTPILHKWLYTYLHAAKIKFNLDSSSFATFCTHLCLFRQELLQIYNIIVYVNIYIIFGIMFLIGHYSAAPQISCGTW